jgi:hypothetical protein
MIRTPSEISCSLLSYNPNDVGRSKNFGLMDHDRIAGAV